ncbi:MAG TPA: carboxymuconolactone decarboxylase family protein [Gaiellaceae bacterium]|jgi:AhpD family alkylhydroperoxidase
MFLDVQALPATTPFDELAPDGYRAMVGLDGALWLDPRLRELVEVRTAQLHRCAARLARHAREALDLGEKQERLTGLSSWRRSLVFTGRERAALGLAEAIVQADREAIATARRVAADHFDEHELAQLAFACVAANAWDRLELAVGPLGEFG